MGIVEFFQWQWSGYSQAHQNRTNLLIHLLAVPAFIVSAVCLVVAITKLSPVAVVRSVAAMFACVALQVRGHTLEQSQSARLTIIWRLATRGRRGTGCP
jgi:uncharacterized membrane protein YGL010W